MASNKWETLEAREVDETWEMNMHMNPIDEDMEETLKRHRAIFENHADDFVSFIQHTESKLTILFYLVFHRCSQIGDLAQDILREAKRLR